jgi:hypothetical protein
MDASDADQCIIQRVHTSLNAIPAAWQQRFKWTVYTLLFINFVFYAWQDMESAGHTLRAQPTFLQWARAYLTTIDLVAWFVLILFFELETGVLAGRLRRNGARWAIRGMRLVCYVAILHTSFGNVTILRDVQTPRPLPAAADLCSYTDGSWSFLENRGYTTVDEENCAAIGRGPEFFAIDPEPVVTDRPGLTEAVILAWTDLVESLSWLVIVLANEVVIRMQARGISGGAAMTGIGRVKAGLYVLIMIIACYWLTKAQILYFWDEVLWVCGFLAIEGNLSRQRLRLRENRAAAL